MTSQRKTPAQKRAEAQQVARFSEGRRTAKGQLIESARVVDEWMIVIRFAGTGLAPFREARYTAAEVMAMITLPNGMVTPQSWR